MTDVTMAFTNGLASPTPQSPAQLTPSTNNQSTKRKREEGEEDEETQESQEPQEHTNGVAGEENPVSDEKSSGEVQRLIEDIVEILKSHDVKPSILSYSITTETSTEPDTKRQKPDTKTTSYTINGRVLAKTYTTLDDFAKDVKQASTALITDLNLPSGTSRTAQYLPAAPQDIEQATKILGFKKYATDLVARAKAEDSAVGPTTNGVETSKTLINGITKPLTQVTASGEDKVVLTIFGQAPQPKQLFSSFQRTVDSGVSQPLREAGLPAGISTTQIVPTPWSAPVEKQRSTTIGELLGPNPLPPLQPPKPSKLGTTRNSMVGWYQPSTAENTRGRSQVYFNQPISTGQWLEYGRSLPSPDQKRKQRAASLNGCKIPASEDDDEREAKELDAQFCRAYSSFAPTKDNSAAVASTGTVQRIWWSQVGSKGYKKMISEYTDIDRTDDADIKLEESQAPLEDLNLEDIKDAIDHWDDFVVDPALLAEDARTIEEKEVEEVLSGISDLLETLHSYQRNRNLTRVQPPPRPGFNDAQASSAVLKPSETEQATYNVLKSQLSLMISSLPPYAVAKLNSDQLEELSISTKIPIPIEDRKGIMDEDEATARAKVAAMSAAAVSRPSQPSSTHRTSSTGSLYANQYSSTPRPAAPNSHSFYGTQTPIRPPTANLQRPPATAQGLYAPRPTSSTTYQPQGAYKAPQYPHQVPRGGQPAYTAATPGQYFQTPSAQTYAPNSYQSIPQTAPQAAMGGQYRAPSQPAYQQRSATQNGMSYPYNNGIRQGSPQKSLYSPQPSTAQPPNRYSTPTPAITPQSRQFYQAPMTNGNPSRSPVPTPQTGVQSQPMQPQLSSGATGATGYHTVMTPAEQSNMMERQRAQLAQQHTTQHSARSAAQPGAMSASPQPQTNGGTGTSA